MAPLGYNIDLRLLKKLYNESGISKVVKNDVRKLIWQKIADEYNSLKGLAEPLHYKVLSTKYSKEKAKSRTFKTSHKVLHHARNGNESSELKREDDAVTNNDCEWESTDTKADDDPLSDTDFEAHDLLQNADDAGDNDGVDMGVRKFISESRRKIVALELETAVLAKNRMAAARDKMDAENFTAQLKRNLAIIEYNKTLGKNLPLFPIPGCDQTLDETKMCEEF